MDFAIVKTMLGGFLKKLELEEVTVPPGAMAAEFAALQQCLAANGQELRRVRERKSGFVGYYVCKVGEPKLLPG